MFNDCSAHVASSLSLPKIWRSRSTSKTDALGWTSTLRPIAHPSWSVGVSFYCSWTTHRRTLAGWLLITTRQCCTAQSSFNGRVPHICLFLFLKLLLLERAQNSTRSASNSDQSTVDPRITERGPADVECSSKFQCLGPHAKGLRCRQRRFVRVAQTPDHIVPLRDTPQNTSLTRI